MRRRLLFLLIYLVCLFFFLELTSTFFLLTPFGKKCLIGLGRINCDEAWRIRWEMVHVDKLKENAYTTDIFDPHRGWSIKPNLVDMLMSDGKVLNTNSKGIRGTEEYQYGKSTKKRILILGDSFTFGEEVNDNESYSSYLQEMLPLAEVINFGVHGYGHDQMLIYLKEEGIKYKPDVVILGFVDLDMVRNILEFRDYSKPKYELSHGKLILKNYPVPPPDVFLKEKSLRPRFIELLTIIYHGFRKKIGWEKKQVEEITTAILDEMVKQIKNMGAIPLFVHLPVNEQMTRLEEELYLHNYCRNRNVRYESLHPDFLSEVRRGAAFDITKHWSAREHFIAAEVIRKAIVTDLAKNQSGVMDLQGMTPP
jgi:hypothetical protein